MKQNLRRRIIAGLLALICLCMAAVAGVQATIVLFTGAEMSDWKNGTMTYQWGFTLMGIFLIFATLPVYIAFKPQRNNRP
jgi:hypothetical protein